MLSKWVKTKSVCAGPADVLPGAGTGGENPGRQEGTLWAHGHCLPGFWLTGLPPGPRLCCVIQVGKPFLVLSCGSNQKRKKRQRQIHGAGEGGYAIHQDRRNKRASGCSRTLASNVFLECSKPRANLGYEWFFFLIFTFSAMPHGMWELNSLITDWTHIPGIGSIESSPLGCQGSPKNKSFLMDVNSSGSPTPGLVLGPTGPLSRRGRASPTRPDGGHAGTCRWEGALWSQNHSAMDWWSLLPGSAG